MYYEKTNAAPILSFDKSGIKMSWQISRKAQQISRNSGAVSKNDKANYKIKMIASSESFTKNLNFPALMTLLCYFFIL